MEDTIAKFMLRSSRRQWCRSALALAYAEENNQTCLVAAPGMKECMDNAYGATVLDALEAALFRAQELSEKDSKFFDVAAKWICKSGRDPVPFLNALAERSARHRP